MPTSHPKSKTKSKIILPKKTAPLPPQPTTDTELAAAPPPLVETTPPSAKLLPPSLVSPETPAPSPAVVLEPPTDPEISEPKPDQNSEAEQAPAPAASENPEAAPVSPAPAAVEPEVWVAEPTPSRSPEPAAADQSSPNPPPRKKLPKFLIFVILLLLIAVIFAVLLLTKVIRLQPEFLSPLPDHPQVLSFQTAGDLKKKEVIGFLPYWNLKEEPNFQYQLLSQVAFFSLEIDADGSIRKLTPDGNQEPGWTAYKSQAFGTVCRKAKESGAKIILTIQAMDQEVIDSLVNDPARRERTIKQTLEIIELKNLDGLNIDFEYAGSPPAATVKNFTIFLREFRRALTDANPGLTLAVDVFADSADRVRLWDIDNLGGIVDYLIIMGYDFHRINSTIAAPVAPLRGAPEHWQYDISKTLTSFSRSFPLEKIILGVPYYGYEWKTTTEEKYAPTYPQTGALATYKRIQQLIKEKDPSLDWDEISLTPRLFYLEKGQIYQIYYENETSLGLKYDLINEGGLAGAAIWALGYDGNYPNFWNLIKEKFN